MVTAIPSTGWVETLRWLMRRRVRVRVSGPSMWPLLQSGDEVLVAPNRSLQVGDIVVARHPFRTDVHLIKRLDSWDERGHLRLLGDNPSESSDSRTLGAVAPALVVGCVTSRIGSPSVLPHAAEPAASPPPE